MIRIAIAGAAGRMGRNLIIACADDDQVELTQAVDKQGSELLGNDAGLLAGIGTNGIQLSAELDASKFDLLVDFTHPLATTKHVDFCLEHNKKLVIGTTGCDQQLEQKMHHAGKSIALVYAPNMSIGVNLCFKLLKVAAQALGDSVDIEVVESHHRNKVDAPSGTALKMGEVVAQTLGRDLKDCAVYSREGQTGARDRKKIGFQSIRCGDIVGEHTVIFAGEGERIEISHKSSSRMNYAQGAIRASHWIMQKQFGVFTMQDVLEL